MYIPITPSCSHKHTSADHRYRAWCGLTRLIGGEKKNPMTLSARCLREVFVVIRQPPE